MRKIIFCLAGLLLSVSGFSQATADFGIWGGAAGYIGDIEDNTLTQSSFPALGAFFRYNFHRRTSVRAMFLTGKVAAEGPFQNMPDPWSFEKSVQDLSFQVEVNYLSYQIGNKKHSFTSYVMAGAGVAYYNYEADPAMLYRFNPRQIKGENPIDESVIAPTFPFGMGFKFNVGKRLGLGVEYQMRKIFDDRLDNLDDPLAHYNSEGKAVTYSDFIHNNDWTGYLGLYVTYNVFLGTKSCPAYDKKR